VGSVALPPAHFSAGELGDAPGARADPVLVAEKPLVWLNWSTVNTWIPPEFRALVEDVRGGLTRTVPVREVVRWFGFERRGPRRNEYILEAMRTHGITCAPPFDVAFFDEEVTFRTHGAEPRPSAPERPPAPIGPCSSIGPCGG